MMSGWYILTIKYLDKASLPRGARRIPDMLEVADSWVEQYLYSQRWSARRCLIKICHQSVNLSISCCFELPSPSSWQFGLMWAGHILAP